MIRITKVSFAYGKKQVLHNLDITIRPRSLTALLGTNGTGKSTLFSCLSKQRRCSQGTILVSGKNINAYTYREYARIVSFVPQISESRRIDSPVRDFLVEGRTPYLPLFSVPGRSEYLFMREVAEKVGIVPLLDCKFSELSGGQQQLVSLTRALVQDTPILLLDEPMSALDMHNQAFLIGLIQKLSDAGKTIIFSTHDPNHALMLDCQIVVLQNGAIACAGRASDCLTNELLREIYGSQVGILRCGNRSICALTI